MRKWQNISSAGVETWGVGNIGGKWGRKCNVLVTEDQSTATNRPNPTMAQDNKCLFVSPITFQGNSRLKVVMRDPGESTGRDSVIFQSQHEYRHPSHLVRVMKMPPRGSWSLGPKSTITTIAHIPLAKLGHVLTPNSKGVRDAGIYKSSMSQEEGEWVLLMACSVCQKQVEPDDAEF